VILRGLALKENGATAAVALLEHWAENPVSRSGDSWDVALASWQKWFRETYPNLPDPKLPEVSEDSKWKFEELLEFLTTGDGLTGGSSTKGALAFNKAQCVKCHRFGDRGERMGPDLSAVSKRFTRKEILESIMFPSHVVSDQFASKTVITTKGRQYTGILTNGAGGEKIVLQANGEKIALREDEIDDIIPNKTSAMPAGLLNALTREEIADLFAYMNVAAKETVVRRTFGEQKK
jgi:putative heme-binding domain-containing protein